MRSGLPWRVTYPTLRPGWRRWSGTLAADQVLDYYNRLVDLVNGNLTRARGVVEISAALHDSLVGVWLGYDGDTLSAEIQLRPTGDSDLDAIAIELFGGDGPLLERTTVIVAKSNLPGTAAGRR